MMRLKSNLLLRIYHEGHSKMKNIKYFTLFRHHELNSKEYLNAYSEDLLPLESVSLTQKHKSYENFSPCTSISSEFEQKYRVGEDHIFVNEHSFKFSY